MTYTIQLDFCIDEDSVASDEEIEEIIEHALKGTGYWVDDVKIIDVND